MESGFAMLNLDIHGKRLRWERIVEQSTPVRGDCLTGNFSGVGHP